MRNADGQLAGVLAEACAQVGLDARAAQPLRVGTNALYRIGRPSMVVRIGLRSDGARIAEKEIRVAEWLAAEGVPAVRPAPGIPQPLHVDGYPVTFWEWVPADAEPPTLHHLGAALRRVHARPAPPFELPAFAPLVGVDAFLAAGDSVDPDALAYLSDECERLRRAYRELTFNLPLGPIHGDAHTGNLMRSAGRAVLIDFETFALGPREWDLVPTGVQLERFGLPGPDYLAFAGAYGADVRSWWGYAVLRRIREVTITAWLLGAAVRQRGASEEFAARVTALRCASDERVWRRF